MWEKGLPGHCHLLWPKRGENVHSRVGLCWLCETAGQPPPYWHSGKRLALVSPFLTERNLVLHAFNINNHTVMQISFFIKTNNWHKEKRVCKCHSTTSDCHLVYKMNYTEIQYKDGGMLFPIHILCQYLFILQPKG